MNNFVFFLQVPLSYALNLHSNSNQLLQTESTGVPVLYQTIYTGLTKGSSLENMWDLNSAVSSEKEFGPLTKQWTSRHTSPFTSVHSTARPPVKHSHFKL